MRRLIRTLGKSGEEAEMKISFLSQLLVNSALMSIPSSAWEGKMPDKKIESAIQIIRNESPRALSNSTVARKIGMNRNAFTRLFREATGHSPRQYLLQLRLEKSRQLLQNSKASLEEIAEQSGFCDRFYFTKLFKRHFKTGPAAFRRRSHG